MGLRAVGGVENCGDCYCSGRVMMSVLCQYVVCAHIVCAHCVCICA